MITSIFQTVFIFLAFLVFTFPLSAQIDIYDSGGPILPEQGAYNVTFYDLDLAVDPTGRRIDGALTMEANVVHPMFWAVLDLDTLLQISTVEEWPRKGQGLQRPFQRKAGKVWIDLGYTRQPGETLRLKVTYGGKPRVAPRPPWNGGFSWEKTADGSPWIATTCQMIGADVWWPCKDHVSDEPDSMALHIRVPDPLVVAANGRLVRKESHDDRTSTYHWFISNPINIYNVALNIAPYQTIESTFTSVAGDDFPVVFYVLPEDYEKGRRLFPEILDHLRFFEKHFGPYPFRADKYGVAQTPHLGMEHQTIIAYGANFNNGSMTGGVDWGFDALHHHELAHEWWGNMVTNFDWRDMWIHEGFGTYTQAMYMEERQGKEGYHAYMNRQRWFGNTMPVAPRESQTSQQIYRAPIYSKGAWVLHTLRFLLGDEVFFQALRRMVYPDPAMEKMTDGSQTRLVTTADFLYICESLSGKDLDWFFEMYLHQPQLPVLWSSVKDNQLHLRWETPGNIPFPMPIEVETGRQRQRIAIPAEGTTLTFKKGEEPVVDPDNWVLLEKGED